MKGDDGMIKNKMYAVALLATGVLSTMVSSDATFLVFMIVIAVPLFFSKKQWIY